jgi:anti-sigma-K factor RskA
MSEGEHMSEMTNCGGDVAAYALDALEPAEAEAFRRHLEQCEICRDELEALQGTVGALPMAAPQHPLPKHVRRRVMRTIHQESRVARAQSRPAWRRSPLRPVVAAAGAALVLAGAVVAGVELSGTSSPSRVIHAQVIGASGAAELRVSGARGELIVHHLTPPPPGHIYEVWLKSGQAAPVPASVLFGVSASGDADVGLPRSLRGVSQVMVSPEPDGGTPAPTTKPVIVVQLT